MVEEGGGWRQGIDLRWEGEGRAAMIDALGMHTVRMIASGRSRVVRRICQCPNMPSKLDGFIRQV